MHESNSHTDASEQCREQTETVELSCGDREAAVKAICDRATGTTTQVAAQILAGIAALDGRRLPILLWPEDVTREEKAAWHDKEAGFWKESAKRFSVVMSARNEPRSPDIPEGSLQSSSPDQPLPHSTSAAPVHCEAEEENRLPSVFGEPAQGSSDAC
ncbi:hypothetical protein [Pseudomonas syringae]|uniref:hypothetical protein n=1 Tax=Pseudomonas syringae TaxID=317 RepID=UPI0011D179F9|nr:hypothetical protein [Pseudomonas syringae]